MDIRKIFCFLKLLNNFSRFPPVLICSSGLFLEQYCRKPPDFICLASAGGGNGLGGYNSQAF